jgi:hypothetical protein
MSDVTSEIDRPTYGPQGEPCSECGALLARDQRYCLQCGTRRAGMGALLAPPSPVVAERVTEPVPPPAPSSPWRLDAGLLAGVGCLLLALLVGVLIGRNGGGDDTGGRAATPQVVTVGATATPATGAAAAAPTAFTSDWPAGKRGFTVQLQVLAKGSADPAAVAAAKQAATGKGAPDVGALDSDAYGTLDPGNYVLFSGEYADRKAAEAALGKLTSSFPDAKVVEVAEKAATKAATGSSKSSASSADATKASGKTKKPSSAEQHAGAKAIQDIENSSGKDYSKKSAKLPDNLATPGEAPPIDKSKPAGGGSDTQTFP